MNPELKNFLDQTEWNTAKIEWFDADWSVRRYARLAHPDGQTAILLDSPPDHDPQSMIGHQVGAWVKIDKHLRALGLNAPKIYAENLENGFVLLEDFGNDDMIGKSETEYLAATDILITMRDHPDAKNIDLSNYKDTHVYKALRFFPHYVLKQNNSEQEWFDAWDEIENTLPPCPQILTHIDFAPMNLMCVGESIGILDFQGACFAPFVYDIVNLLDDARREISETLKQSCIDHYCAALSPSDTDIFHAWYPVIKAQFHARVLGQILKLKTENGRNDLMQYYEPLSKRFEKELQDPALAPILRFIEEHK